VDVATDEAGDFRGCVEAVDGFIGVVANAEVVVVSTPAMSWFRRACRPNCSAWLTF
jgi:hypothetical protein